MKKTTMAIIGSITSLVLLFLALGLGIIFGLGFTKHRSVNSSLQSCSNSSVGYIGKLGKAMHGEYENSYLDKYLSFSADKVATDYLNFIRFPTFSISRDVVINDFEVINQDPYSPYISTYLLNITDKITSQTLKSMHENSTIEEKRVTEIIFMNHLSQKCGLIVKMFLVLMIGVKLSILRMFRLSLMTKLNL